MCVFLNEESLFDERIDINEIVNNLHEILPHLKNSDVTVYAYAQKLKDWNVFWGNELDLTRRAYLMQVFQRIENCDVNPGDFLYYLFKKTEGRIEQINNSGIIRAADRILLNQNIVILNIPVSSFCNRNYLPVIKTPNNPRLPDELANVPCFNNAKKIIQHLFVHNKIKPFLEILNSGDFKIKFKEFYNHYMIFCNGFDFENWCPNTILTANKLDETLAFPASTNDYIKEELNSWGIVNGSYEDNKAQYKLVGELVLETHGYSRNNPLSSHYRRDIFEGGSSNSKLLISIDTENGLFEVIGSNGIHIGVYKYDGSYHKHYTNTVDIQSHSLIDIPRHLFLTP